VKGFVILDVGSNPVKGLNFYPDPFNIEGFLFLNVKSSLSSSLEKTPKIVKKKTPSNWSSKQRMKMLVDVIIILCLTFLSGIFHYLPFFETTLFLLPVFIFFHLKSKSK
jgi:hypothetical protein